MKKFLFVLGITTYLTTSAQAGLLEGIMAYQYKQYPTALAEFTYLAEEGNPAAAYYLGKIYQEGLGTSKNINKAFDLFQSASSAYYFPATTEIGKMLLDTSNRNGNPTKGIELLKKAALAGEAEAAFELGKIYTSGLYTEPNPNYAYGYFLMASLQGNMKAQHALAKLYIEGSGVPQDYKEALKWLARSANQGYVLAQVELADLRMTDTRLKSLADAYGWYSIIAAYNSDDLGKKAAVKRDALAEEMESEDLAKKQDKIRSWKPVTAEKSVPEKEKEETQIPVIPGFNDPQALQELLDSEGYLPRSGYAFGITHQMIDSAIANQNVDELTNAIERAFKKVGKEAYGYYGDLYKTRLDNQEQAFSWYKKGAEAGDSYAEYQLAKMYCEGKGIPQPDAVSCYAWLKIAQGKQNPILNGLIQNALGIVRNNATPEELNAGESLVETLKNTSEEEKGTKNHSFF